MNTIRDIEQVKTLVGQTPWGDIAEKVCKKIGLPVDRDLFKVTVSEGMQKRPRLCVESRRDLVCACGILTSALASVRVENFGGEYGINDEGEAVLWMPIHFGYKHIDGGSNGLDLMTVFYNVTNDELTIRERR